MDDLDDSRNVLQQALRRAQSAIAKLPTKPDPAPRTVPTIGPRPVLDGVQERFLEWVAQLLPPATPEAPPQPNRAVFRRVADVQARPIRWLWPGRIAQGKVSIIAGNPGLGKSQITLGMAATVSTGGLWPVDGQCCEVGL